MTAKDTPSLSHIDATGRARMVDVSHKPTVAREAVAQGHIRLQTTTLDLIRGGHMPKGEVLATARIAAIQAAKRTSDWIPLCHPLPLSGIAVAIAESPSGLTITATVRTTDGSTPPSAVRSSTNNRTRPTGSGAGAVGVAVANWETHKAARRGASMAPS